MTNASAVRRLWSLAGAVLAVCLVLSACGTAAAPESSLDLNPYTIDFAAAPAVPTAGAPVVLKIAVNGKAPVPKRSEIYYEIKKTGSEDRKEVPAESKGENRYEGTYTFPEAGFYTVIIHVTTRAVHQIVNQQLEVK
jgi:hypothetical protein